MYTPVYVNVEMQADTSTVELLLTDPPSCEQPAFSLLNRQISFGHTFFLAASFFMVVLVLLTGLMTA